MTTSLTTIVVNFNTRELLDDCLNSVIAATPRDLPNELVVVDNASTDGSVEHIRRHWPDVTLLVNEENAGFCRANNQAIRHTDSTHLLLINTDARLTPGSVAALMGHLRSDDRVAIAAPRLQYADGTFQRWTAGRLPTCWSMAWFLLGCDRLAKLRHRSHGLYLSTDTSTPFRPEWVSSAVMVARRGALAEIGLFDERIFLYMDDVDLCARLAQADWSVLYAADVTATHFMGSSSGRPRDGRPSPEALRSLNRWYVRRHGKRAGLALRAIEALGFGARVCVHGARAMTGRPEARSQVLAHSSHLLIAMEAINA